VCPTLGDPNIATAPHLSAAEHEWTVLVIGDGPLGAQLMEELERQGQDVEEAETDNASTAVMVSAPDMVVLVGDAADDRGERVLGALAEGSHSAVAPVMVIGDSSRAQVHPNYRHGPVAALSNKLPIPLLAKRVLELAREVPDRSGEQSGPVTGDQLGTLVEGLSADKRSGTLDVTPDETTGESESLVMAAGESVSESTDEFVARVQPQLEDAPGSFRFKERSGGTTDSVAPPRPAGLTEPELPAAPTSTAPPPPTVRLLVVDGDPARANSLAQALRDGGSVAHAISDVRDIDAAASTDAHIMLMTPTHMRTRCKAIIEAIEAHPRLRWASTLLAPQGLLWPPDGSDPNLDVLQRKFDKLTEPDQKLAAQTSGARFETRLEVTGPGRMLRAIAACGEPRRVVVRHPRVKVAITMERGHVVQATAKPVDRNTPVEGSAALSTLFAIRSGRVEVSPVKPAITLHSAPSLEDALDRAASVASPVAPSIVPPAPAAVPAPRSAAQPTPPVPADPPSGQLWQQGPAFEPPEAAALPAPPESSGEITPPPPAFMPMDSGAFDSEGSGVIELASGPLPLSSVLGLGRAPNDGNAEDEEHGEFDIDLRASVPDGFAQDEDPPELPRTSLAAALADTSTRLGTLSATGMRIGRNALSGARRIGERIDLDAIKVAARPALEALARRAAAVPPKVRMGAASALGAILIAVIAWPSGDGQPEASASARAAVQPTAPVAAPPAPVAAPPEPPSPAEPTAAAPSAEQAAEPIPAEPATEEVLAAEPELAMEALEPPPPAGTDRASRVARAQHLQRMASRLRRQGRLGLAESKYLEALAEWPRYPLAMAGVVRLHLARKDGREAVRWARKLVRVQPKRGNNQLLLGDAYMLRRNVSKAKAAYRQSARYGNRTAKKRIAAL